MTRAQVSCALVFFVLAAPGAGAAPRAQAASPRPTFLPDRVRGAVLLRQGKDAALHAPAFAIRPADLPPVARAVFDEHPRRCYITHPAGERLPPSRAKLAAKVRARAAAGVPGTVRVAAFRVDFLADRGGPLTTSPDGRFDLGLPGNILIDAPPHNAEYFRAHFEAIRRYYATMSYGSVNTEIDLYPAGRDSAYHLGDAMDYGPWIINATNPDPIARAEEFVRAAIHAADVSGDIDWGAYDGFILIHAGADFQGDINNDSPRDIPSFFIDLGVPAPVGAGTDSVPGVLVLPETVTQDDFPGALNGVFAHEFGHLLGLPDLYNIATNSPVVGQFSLMDSGENLFGALPDAVTGDPVYYRGLIPTSLDPWSKLFLFPGAIQVHDVEDTLATVLRATESFPEILKAPIANDEYFLGENREFDLDGNGTLVLRADQKTGVLLGPEGDPDLRDKSGTREYDFLLPGSGVLLWHVDESVISGRNYNRDGGVNTNPRRRGLRVMEADGITDIGNPNSDSYLGGEGDYWALGGGGHVLSPSSVPSSDGNGPSKTGITIDVLSSPGISMQVRAKNERGVKGFPVTIDGEPGSAAAVTADQFAGRMYVATQRRIVAVPLPGVGFGLPGTAAEFDTTILGAIAAGGRSSPCGSADSPLPFVACTLTDGTLYTQGRVRSLPGFACSTPPVIRKAFTYVGGRDGSVARVDPCGNVERLAPISLAAVTGTLLLEEGDIVPEDVLWFLRADGTVSNTAGGPATPIQTSANSGFLAMGEFRGDRTQQILVADTTGVLSLWNKNGTPVPGWPVHLDSALHDPPALFDLDRDGAVEAILRTVTGRVHVLNWDGSEVPGWPKLLPGDEPFAAPPVGIQTLSGPALLVGGESGRLFLLDAEGNTLPGWPLSTGSFLPRWVGFVAGVDEPLVYSVGKGGGVVLFSMRPESPTALWSEPGGGPERRFVAAPPVPPAAAPLLAGDDLFCYPNPSRGEPVRIHYVLGKDASVSVRVFRLTGEEIDAPRITPAGLAGAGEASLLWDVSDIASGVYWVRLEAKSGSATRSELRKVAILK